MPVHLHRAERTDLLADALADVLARPLADPFTTEVVVVPAKGVERWLSQRLSHRLGVGAGGGDGVCAGVDFVSPGSLISVLLGRERDDAWDPDRLVWPLLECIDHAVGEPWAAALARHLGHGLEGEEGALREGRRFAVAHRLAILFARYARQRPGLIADWSTGGDTDGLGQPVPGDLAWQPELWRRLAARVPVPSPEQRQLATVAALRADAGAVDLPERVSLFGHTRLSVTDVELLGALAAHRDVHLWLPQASPVLWDDLRGVVAAGPVARAEDPSVEYAGHPLLASLGRDSRELQRSLAPLDGELHDHSGADLTPDTVLGLLQADIRGNRPPTAEELAARRTTEQDRSVQVHACHGPARQIEVLREVLVGLLDDDPTLEPRDIVVMCPDVETYAPLIHAAFGLRDSTAPVATSDPVAADDGHPGHRLRVRLADRSLTSTNPLLGVAETLVALAGGRARASDVLDLLARDVCRRRFRLDDDDLARVAGWVEESGVRWGLDSAWRGRFSMGKIGQNTWQAGLERILAGVAMSGDDHVHLGRALPLDDVSSSDVELAGSLAEFVDRLGTCLRGLDEAESVHEWLAVLTRGVLSLTDVPSDDAWQRAQLERELARTAEAAGAAGGTGGTHDAAGESARLRLADVRALLSARFAGRPTRANFRTGTLTVCTMVPMRSVPHRVVCLVGLDDGRFPRGLWIDGDDVLSRTPQTGEQDRRAEDRQLLLDAIMAAGDALVVCYTGADEHTGALVPPAVPVGELLDAVDATAVAPDGGRLSDRLRVRHPLQAHHWRNLTVAPGEPAAVGRGRPFSFDRAALRGATAAAGPPRARPAFLPDPLPAREPADVSLADLRRFFAHPVREFAKSRLQIGTPLEADEVHDAIPVELDNLESWSVGDRLLADVLAGLDPQAAMLAEQLRGTLPPGGLGIRAMRSVTEQVQALYESTQQFRVSPARAVDVSVDLGGGRLLTGTVTGVHGNRAVDIRYSRPKAKQRIESWLGLLALSASYPDESWTGVIAGRERRRAVGAVTGPVDQRAVEWLRDLVTIYDEGHTRPLPAPPLTALAWQSATAEGGQPAVLAGREWVTDPHNKFGIQGEDADPWHVRAFGERTPLPHLIQSGLPDLAARIWGPLLTHSPQVRPL